MSAVRCSGTLMSWHEDRGFGFIAPTQGGPEMFVHISAFPRDGTAPTIGEKLAYEVGAGHGGKPQAVKVRREALLVSTTARRIAGRPKTSKRSVLVIIAVVVLGIGLFARAYKHSSVRPEPLSAVPSRVDASAGPVVKAAAFRCDGRTHCSQMTSCHEAEFFLKYCPVAEMDGDSDGVPCEQQWCTGSLRK